MEAIFVFIVLAMCSGILFIGGKTTSANENVIEFKFANSLKNKMLICIIILLVMFIVFAVIFLTGISNTFAHSIVFTVIIIIASLVYMLLKNKKIVYKDKTLYYYNMFGKVKEYKVSDISNAIEKPGDGMIIVFSNGRKIKIDVQMNNYSKIKEILNGNNIKYTDTRGNIEPKGW